jgi:hypothetical protein
MQAQELADIATIYDKTEVFIFAMMYTNGYRIICIIDDFKGRIKFHNMLQ